MALFQDFAAITSGNVRTAIDTYNTALYNNGALNALGSLYAIPPSPANVGIGSGSALIVRYVRYNSTANPSGVAGPAPVYYTDETLTTVSGVSTESAAGL